MVEQGRWHLSTHALYEKKMAIPNPGVLYLQDGNNIQEKKTFLFIAQYLLAHRIFLKVVRTGDLIKSHESLTTTIDGEGDACIGDCCSGLL